MTPVRINFNGSITDVEKDWFNDKYSREEIANIERKMWNTTIMFAMPPEKGMLIELSDFAHSFGFTEKEQAVFDRHRVIIIEVRWLVIKNGHVDVTCDVEGCNED